MDKDTGLELLEKTKIIAVVHGIEREQILPLIEALYEGGIRLVQIPLNTLGSFYMLKDAAKQWGRSMFIGAGAVLDAKDAKEAAEAGAGFLATPHVDKRTIEFGLEERLPVWAGGLTPTEIVKAWKTGAEAVRLFPVSPLGAAYAEEIKQSFNHIPLIAGGHIHPGNIAAYLRAGCTGCEIYSNLLGGVPEGGRRSFEAITEEAAKLVSRVKHDLNPAARKDLSEQVHV